MENISNNINNCSVPRNSSIELLRIISMLMITFFHFAYHGGFEWETTFLTVSHCWYNFLLMGGKIGVDVFILISGYFLIRDNGTVFNLKRILKFWGQILFYSVSIYIISVCIGLTSFDIKSAIRCFFPITNNFWWFASTYFVLYLLHPFLNKLLNNLGKKKYQYLLILLVVCWSVIPTFTTSQFQGNSLLWFVTLYSIAGYIRIYGLNSKLKSRHYFMLWIVFLCLTYLSNIILTVLGAKHSVFASNTTAFFSQEKINILFASIALFMAFATLKMNYHKWINIIASATFGIYLIHDSKLIYPYLWHGFFKNAQYQNSVMLIPYSIFAVICVFTVCMIIDLIRQKLFEKPYIKMVDKFSPYALDGIKKICNVCMNTICGKESD